MNPWSYPELVVFGLGWANLILLLVLAASAALLARLHRRRETYYFSAAWALNAVYLVVETIVAPSAWSGPMNTVSFWIGLPSSILLVLSSRNLSRRRLMWVSLAGLMAVAFLVDCLLSSDRRTPATVSAVMAPGIVFSVLAAGLLGYRYLTMHPARLLDADPDADADASTESAVVLTGANSVRADGQDADSPRPLVDPAVPRGRRDDALPLEADALRMLRVAQRALGAGLVGYALLQPLYFTKPFVPGWPNGMAVMLFGYTAALAAKLAVGTGLALLLSAEFLYVTRTANRQSVILELGFMASALEHDIRGQLSALNSATRAIERSLPELRLPPEREARLTGPLKLIKRAASHIDQILALVPGVRATRDFVKRHSNPVNLSAVADRAIQQVEDTGRGGKSTRFVYERRDSKAQTVGFERHIAQSLVNVITNAAEAALENERVKPPRVTVSTWVTDDASSVEVVDTGKGFSPESLRRARRPGFTTKDTSESANRGIGLFTAARMISNHDGTLELGEHEGGGARVVVRLPRYKGKKRNAG